MVLHEWEPLHGMLSGLCFPDKHHQFIRLLYNVGTLPSPQVIKGHLADDISNRKKLRCKVPCFRYGRVIVVAGSDWKELSLLVSTWVKAI